MENNMQLVCRMWKFSAMEYMKFLKRYGIECYGISIVYGTNIAVYANEEKYLSLSLEDNKFNQNEKQLIDLLKLLESAIEEFSKHSGQHNENFKSSDEEDTDSYI